MDEILKNRPRGQKPWMTETILKKIAERDELFLKMKENPSEHARQIYEEQYRKVRNVIVTLTRRAKRDYKKSVKPHVESAMMMSLQQLSEPMMNGAAALGQRVSENPKITVANQQQQPYYAHDNHAKYRSKIYHQPQNINLSQSAHNFGSTHIDFQNAGSDNFPIMIDRNLDVAAPNHNFVQHQPSNSAANAGMTYKEYDSLLVQDNSVARPVSPVLRQPKSPSAKNNFGFKAFSDREGCKPQIVTSSIYGWVDTKKFHLFYFEFLVIVKKLKIISKQRINFTQSLFINTFQVFFNQFPISCTRNSRVH